MDIRAQIYALITERHITSITYIAQQVGYKEDEVSQIITQLVESGELIGEFSDDGTRFFSESPKLSSGIIIAEPPLPRHKSKEEIDCLAVFLLCILGISLTMIGSIVLSTFSFGMSDLQKLVFILIFTVGMLLCIIDLIYISTGWFPFYDRLTRVQYIILSTIQSYIVSFGTGVRQICSIPISKYLFDSLLDT